MIHTVKGFGVVNEAEIHVFLEFSCFVVVVVYDPTDVGNMISGSSALSKSSLYIWKFLVHVLLKSSLKDFENYLAPGEMGTTISELEYSLAFPFWGLE